MTYDRDTIIKAMHRVARVTGRRFAPWCEEAGISEATLRAFFRGTTKSITVENAIRLADVAGVTLHELLGIEEQPRRPVGHSDSRERKLMSALLTRLTKENEATTELLRDLLQLFSGGTPEPAAE